jgi:hypothetical protein
MNTLRFSAGGTLLEEQKGRSITSIKEVTDSFGTTIVSTCSFLESKIYAVKLGFFERRIPAHYECPGFLDAKGPVLNWPS